LRCSQLAVASCLVLVVAPRLANAQETPPPVGPLVIDVHGVVPRLGTESDLGPSRGLLEQQLPGTGYGVDIAAHFYPYRWRSVTLGVGGRVLAARARSGISSSDLATDLPGVTETYLAAAPELSFNFGTGNGWSYISGGLGRARWSVVADGQALADIDRELLRIVHYGAGARWFAKRHVAFAVDVRFYQNEPGTPRADRPATPRSSHMMLAAGVSFK
jgi:hypothetical protein